MSVSSQVVWDVIRKFDSKAVIRRSSVPTDGQRVIFSSDSLSGKQSYAAASATQGKSVSLNLVTKTTTTKSKKAKASTSTYTTLVGGVRTGNKVAPFKVTGGSRKAAAAIAKQARAGVLRGDLVKVALARSSALGKAAGRAASLAGTVVKVLSRKQVRALNA